MAKKENGKLSGLKEDGTPNAYWRKFKERLNTYDQVPIQEWKEDQVLGHILKRYKDFQGVEFTLSYSGPPSKCKEIYCIRRMVLSLGFEDGVTLKKYIDWVFDSHILPKKISLTSIAFFFTTNFVLKFKQELRKSNTVSRNSVLPEKYLLLSSDLDISTYGDLAFAKRAIDQNPEEYKQYSDLLIKLIDNGFNIDSLNNLEG